ncbi:zinc-binding dehydrogenase [Nitzschia inconspicua]|uniref:Zinc-binding dehydrogenase n=1 Tax=Nitzschia inconspicua TaxID=303405 RepID=A0A9K3LME5_9STRA|nr:zinc-binding dehydrogenase [Nitzschia inconspicua]
MMEAKDEISFKLFGQDLNVILAVVANILSWLVATLAPSFLSYLLPNIDEEDKSPSTSPVQTQCIAIGRPGGIEQLRTITLKPGFVTVGYNLGFPSPFVNLSDKTDEELPSGTVVVEIQAFSVNYADCCIRWGLYESANKFVGWPIVPGFDIAGVVERVSASGDTDNISLAVGDKVYGATFFGAYSSRCLVPGRQLRRIPSDLSFAEAASLPAVSMTALYTLYLGGRFPAQDCTPQNKSILIHSAAGGVGGMLVQMSKLLGLSPVVGIVGRSSKVDHPKSLGCDTVIDKSGFKSPSELWEEIQSANKAQGYSIIADANGVSTLRGSFDHLCATGRLVVFGFHSNLPMGQDMLNPWVWLQMIWKMAHMPKFDAMDLVVSNKSLLGFNLSFFVDEISMLGQIYDQIGAWLKEGKLVVPRITELPMAEIGTAHQLLQSGKSVGKIVMLTKSET